MRYTLRFCNLRSDLRAAAGLAAVIVLLGLLTGCERAPRHPQLEAARLPRLVPAHEFVFNRQSFGGFAFSPDGRRLAWTGPSGWRSALHVRDDASARVHTYHVGTSGIRWSADSRRLLMLEDKSGQENHHLYRLDVDAADAKPVDLTPHAGVRVWLHQILKDDPEHVLVLHNRRDRRVRDLYRINLTTGAETLLAQNPGDGVFPVTDRSGKLVAWKKSTVVDRPRAKPRPPELQQRSAIRRQTEDLTRTVGVSPDRAHAWMISNHGRDRIALLHADARTGTVNTVHEDPGADIARVVVSERDGRPVLVSATRAYPNTTVLDRELAADLAPLLKEFDGKRIGFDIVTMDPAERRVVIAVITHADRRYYLVDRDRKTHSLLGATRSADFGAAMVEPQAVEVRARDGMMLVSYLLKPPGLAAKPTPLVLLVHGGPWQRVAWSDPDHSEDMLRAQFLANRGYAVLVVNFRGSTGFGRAYMSAAVGEFGAKMQDDLVDAARWAIDAGIADPDRIALMGYSYGGYATLMALAQQPKAFACGIDIAGPTDLAKAIEDFPPYWELELTYWYGFVGDPAVAADRERMQKVSPINLAARIERPVLIMQGAKDVRVRVAQSRAMAERLKSAGKDVRYVEIEDMGHSLGYWAHHLMVLRKSENFLAECLGGRAARFDIIEWVARLTGRLAWGT